MFTNFAQNFPMVQNGINFAKKMPNFAYFVNKIYPEIPSKFFEKFREIQAKVKLSGKNVPPALLSL